jgi:ribulose 1,5-bisphosphate synthetase/thiazole synthase
MPNTTNAHHQSKEQSEKMTYDVIVIGAGLSGLQAAQILSQRGKNILVWKQKTG